ncbi:hypothetical protein EC9_53900 [Rosistilla ulvae]|uniref:Uncharacterized protein n=1 Tax=Rosistilla ulvae TaxID=1930277 RepID=A0A517M8G6_9BACT|nr:hypothetical protein [Rosistilla ulvae]QDS91170.1 hypothetical protein EC9_53900 [Rosistilla ulvae]
MNDDTLSPPFAPPRWLKIAISIAVVVHLWAVVAEPIRFSTRGPGGPSPAASAFRAPVGRYVDFLYLSHGYAFFAPDPGPSHLVAASWIDADGQPQTETFPDRNNQWPRLLYHRHFMLTEFLHNMHEPRSLPPDVPRDSVIFRDWRSGRDRYEMIRDGFANHLQHVHGGSAVQIDRVEHRMPGIPEFVEERIDLQNERLYLTLPDGLPAFDGIAP